MFVVSSVSLDGVCPSVERDFDDLRDSDFSLIGIGLDRSSLLSSSVAGNSITTTTLLNLL